MRIKQTGRRKPSELDHSDDGDDDGVDVVPVWTTLSFKVGLQRPLQAQTVSACWVKSLGGSAHSRMSFYTSIPPKKSVL